MYNSAEGEKKNVIKEVTLVHFPTVLSSGIEGLHFTEHAPVLPGEALCSTSVQLIFTLWNKL